MAQTCTATVANETNVLTLWEYYYLVFFNKLSRETSGEISRVSRILCETILIRMGIPNANLCDDFDAQVSDSLHCSFSKDIVEAKVALCTAKLVKPDKIQDLYDRVQNKFPQNIYFVRRVGNMGCIVQHK
jgi:hypothetical protein